MARPTTGEYADFYSTYVDKVPEADIVAVLRAQASLLRHTLEGLSDEQALQRYEPGKWSIKEVVGHVVDAERIFSHRAFWFARDVETPQPGMDQDPFVTAAGFDRRPLDELLQDFTAAREHTLRLFESFTEEEWDRRGVASDSPVSVRALAYILAGHVRHHLGVLQERYLPDGR